MELVEEATDTSSGGGGEAAEGAPAAHHDEMLHDDGNQPQFVNALDVCASSYIFVEFVRFCVLERKSSD